MGKQKIGNIGKIPILLFVLFIIATATNTATISRWDKTKISTHFADIPNYKTDTGPVTGITDKIGSGNTRETAEGIVIDDAKVPVNSDKPNVYRTNFYNNTVSVIDTSTNTVTATIPVGNNPIGLEIAPDDSKVYVANSGSNDVSVIDTATNTVVDTIPTEGKPVGVEELPLMEKYM